VRLGPVAVPEAHEREHGINGAFGCGAQICIGAGGVTHATHFPVGTENAAVGRDFLDARLAQAEMGDGLSARQRFAHGHFQVGYHLSLKAAFVLARVHAGVFKNAFRRKIAIRGVVMM